MIDNLASPIHIAANTLENLTARGKSSSRAIYEALVKLGVDTVDASNFFSDHITLDEIQAKYQDVTNEEFMVAYVLYQQNVSENGCKIGAEI